MSQPQTIHYMQYGHAACLIPGVPGRDWPDNHVWSPDPKEVTCSACLQGMKYGESTFEILEEGKAIRCRRCGMISYSPKDVENHWCPGATPATTTFGRLPGWPGCRATPSRLDL
jgi:DNA-directed RNA polymerase subunit RPC12/RpoP